MNQLFLFRNSTFWGAGEATESVGTEDGRVMDEASVGLEVDGDGAGVVSVKLLYHPETLDPSELEVDASRFGSVSCEEPHSS